MIRNITSKQIGEALVQMMRNKGWPKINQTFEVIEYNPESKEKYMVVEIK